MWSRQRLGLALFQRLFDRVVELCQAAGLVWGKELFFDSTKVQANADMDSLTPRFAQAAREHLAQLFASDGADAASGDATTPPDAPTPLPAAGTAVLPDAPAAPTTLPFAGTPAQHTQLVAEHDGAWHLLAEHRLDPNRPPSGSGAYRRSTDFRVSTTDPDATPLNKEDSGKLGYRDHYVVDGGKARIIVGVLVTPADVQDNQAFLDPLDRSRFRFHLHVKRAVADAKYSTGENLWELAQRGIIAYMPLVEYRKNGAFFRQQDFTYDPETDSYRCPQGETLPYRATHYEAFITITIYQAPAATCAACPLRARCTDSASGRKVSRSFDEDYREELRQRQTTEAYKKALRKRAVWVEPLFGEAKQWHQLRRFLLRGLDNVNIQALLVATGQNLKRYLAAVHRGQRPAHAQRAVTVLASWCPT